VIGASGRPRRVWSGYSNSTILMVRMNDSAEIHGDAGLLEL
jgi:hypothetical protein